MNELTQQQRQMAVAPQKASLLEIRTDSRKFPRLYTYRREDAVNLMNGVILMAYQYRGQQADTCTIVQMSSSLIDILLEDEFAIGTRYISFEEIKRIVKKAVLGQGKEMFGISVSSIFQAIADYCKGEGRVASQQAREVAAKQRELKDSIIAPMIEGMAAQMLKR
jgi:hypothetical protein